MTYWFFSILIIAISSCTQEELPFDEPTPLNNRIYFRSYLPQVTATSRSEILTAIDSCMVSCFSVNDNEVTPYFRESMFIKGNDGKFTSDNPQCVWEDQTQQLYFYAFYPSLSRLQQIIDDENDMTDKDKQTVRNEESNSDEMADGEEQPDGNEIADGNEEKRYFEVEASEETTDVADFRYNLKNFRITTDISKQVDFVTAHNVGSSNDNSAEGVTLNFHHQLAALQLEAWGAHKKYDFEIAGACIGNAVVEATFTFSASSQAGPISVGYWELGETPVKERVEHIFSTGEDVVTISKTAGLHSEKGNAASIFDKSGVAMVIPTNGRMEAWEGKADPNIGHRPYSTDKIYFSVLLRVTDSATKGEVYPFPNDKDNMAKVYFVVDKDNKIVSRLYHNPESDKYYQDQELTQEYQPNDEVSVKRFGWAALPVVANWQAGKTYKYTLDYSQGIGWQDPRDPDPGEPILDRTMSPFTCEVKDWIEASDYTPDLNVPKK